MRTFHAPNLPGCAVHAPEVHSTSGPEARKHSLYQQGQQPDQNHRLRAGTAPSGRRQFTRDVRNAGVHRSRSCELRGDWILDRYMECRGHLLCLVSRPFH